MKNLQSRRVEKFGLATDFARIAQIAPADIIAIEHGLLDHVPAKALLAYARFMGMSPSEITEKRKTFFSDLMGGGEVVVMPQVSQGQRFEILCELTQEHMHDRRTVELIAHKLGLK